MYKFRAWLKDRKEMIKVYNIDFDKKMINTNSAWRCFDEVELMLFTGLFDLKGTEIYEGDIVQFRVGYDYKHLWKGFVDFADASFRINCGFIKHYRWIDYDVEVIGNIYENPELLEEVE